MAQTRTVVSRYLAFDNGGGLVSMATFGRVANGTLEITWNEENFGEWGEHGESNFPTAYTATLAFRLYLSGTDLAADFKTLVDTYGGDEIDFLLHPDADGGTPGTATATQPTWLGKLSCTGFGPTPGEGVAPWIIDVEWSTSGTISTDDGVTVEPIKRASAL